MKKIPLFLLFIPMTVLARGPSDPLPVGYRMFPSTNVWYTDISNANVSSSNTVWMDTINGHTAHNLHPDFGNTYLTQWNGIPYNIVYSSNGPLQVVTLGSLAYQSDTQPVAGIPIPTDAIAENDIANSSSTGGGDQHLILVDMSSNVVYEMFVASRTAIYGTTWTASQFTQWFSSSNAMRTDGWTSADAGGLPILAGLIRYDEIQAGSINHAIRFTLSLTELNKHIWPARHDTTSGGVLNPPFGMRVRMKANVDISFANATDQIIFKAMKKYGMILADNGGDWFVGGAPSTSWDQTSLHNDFITVGLPKDIFEVVDESNWIVDPNSAQAQAPPGPPIFSIQMR